MRQMHFMPRLFFAGMLILTLAIIGAAVAPVTVSADGGTSDPPVGGPKDTIPELGGGGATVGDIQVDLVEDSFGTGALLYGVWAVLTVI